jgi:uncharacterized protein
MDVIVPEYRGYSIRSNIKPGVKETHRDMDNLILYLSLNRIIFLPKTYIIGRSIGSLFATRLSMHYKFAFLTLVAPFYSVKHIVQSKLGKFLASMVEEKDEPF